MSADYDKYVNSFFAFLQHEEEIKLKEVIIEDDTTPIGGKGTMIEENDLKDGDTIQVSPAEVEGYIPKVRRKITAEKVTDKRTKTTPLTGGSKFKYDPITNSIIRIK